MIDDFNLRRLIAEVAAENGAHARAELTSGERARILGVEIDIKIVERAEHIIEHAREIERAHVALKKIGLRRAVKAHRLNVKLFSADAREHVGRNRNDVGAAAQPGLHRSVAVDEGAGRGERFMDGAGVERGIGNLGKLLGVGGEEAFGDLGAPGDSPQDANRLFSLAQDGGGGGEAFNGGGGEPVGRRAAWDERLGGAGAFHGSGAGAAERWNGLETGKGPGSGFPARMSASP